MTLARFAGLALLGLAVSAGAACNQQQAAAVEAPSSAPPPALAPAHDHAAPQSTSGQQEPLKRYDGPLPPIPAVSFVPPRSPEVVQATYEFAGRRPDVLQYMPCFCMCERSGHVGNDDCFVRTRDATGKPTWDLHGMG
jgi:hypothetical protein